MLKNFIKLSVYLLLVTNFISVQAAVFPSVYSHYSEEEDLVMLLTDFARSQGYTAKVSESVSGNVSGNFDNMQPQVFLETMKAAFGVRFFVIGKTINFYSDTEWTRSIYKPSAVSARKLSESLKDSQVVSQDLPLQIDSNALLIVEGPKFYVDNVLEVAKNFDRGQENDVVIKIYKLKHAKVSDTTISTSSRTIVVPGVATILDRMVSGNTSNILSNSMTVSINSQKMNGLRGSGLAAETSGTSSDSIAPTTVDSSVDQSGNSSFTPRILADERLNALIIHDYKHRIPFYESVIAELDVPVKMVELHAAVVDVDVNATNSLGVDLGFSTNNGNWGFGGASGTMSSSVPSDPLISNTSGGVFSTVFNSSHSSFMMRIKALESESLAKTLGRPSVLTLDNLEATLESTTTNYIPVSGNESSDLFKVSGGTVLRVTPHIIEDETDINGPKKIQMIISLQTSQSNDGDDITSASGTENYVPSVKETTINTQAVVKEGQSLLLGGYYVESDIKKDEGVPLLKDIPLLGRLFSSETKVKSKRERLLLITPRIVTLDSDGNVPTSLNEDFDQKPTSDNFETSYEAEPRTDNSPGCSSTRSLRESEHIEGQQK